MDEQNTRLEAQMRNPTWTPQYERRRHGGWYTNVYEYRGGCVCVSRNYPDKKWRIVGSDGPGEPTYNNRDEATRIARSRALADYDHPSCKVCKSANERGDQYCASCGEPLTHDAWLNRRLSKQGTPS